MDAHHIDKRIQAITREIDGLREEPKTFSSKIRIQNRECMLSSLINIKEMLDNIEENGQYILL